MENKKVYVVVKQDHICEEDGNVYEGGHVIIFDNKVAADAYARGFGYRVEEEKVNSK